MRSSSPACWTSCRREAALEGLFAAEGRHPQEPTDLHNNGMTLKNFKDDRGFRQQLPVCTLPVPAAPEGLRVDPQGRGDGHAPGHGRAVHARRLPVGGEEHSLRGRSASWFRSTSSTRPSRASSTRSSSRTIDQAEDNASLEPFDIQLAAGPLPDPLCGHHQGQRRQPGHPVHRGGRCDRLALKRKIEEACSDWKRRRSSAATAISIFFLTNEERDISREIKNTDIAGSEETKVLSELIFQDVFKDDNKCRYARKQEGLWLQPPLRRTSRTARSIRTLVSR